MRLVEVLARHVGHDAVLCSDRADAYQIFARLQGQPHYRIDARPARGSSTRAFHIQTVNNLHGRLHRFLAPFCGPATRTCSAISTGSSPASSPLPIKTAATWHRLLAA